MMSFLALMFIIALLVPVVLFDKFYFREYRRRLRKANRR